MCTGSTAAKASGSRARRHFEEKPDGSAKLPSHDFDQFGGGHNISLLAGGG
jgi:hypothetical protein